MLVAITGVDGAGKSTLCDVLAERLLAHGMRAAVTKAKLVTNPAWLRYHVPLNWVERHDRLLAIRLRASLICLEVEAYTHSVTDLLKTRDIVLCDRYLEAIRLYSIFQLVIRAGSPAPHTAWRVRCVPGGRATAQFE